MNKICGYICEHNKSGVCQITGCTKSTYITNNTRDDSISYKEIKDENTTLKQALNEIRELVNNDSKYDEGDFEGMVFQNDILQIIDKVLGDEK